MAARRRRAGLCGAGAGLALLLGAGLVVAGEGVRIVGSDLLGHELTRELVAFAGARSRSVALALDGSRRGLEELQARRADCALLVSSPTTQPPEGFTALPIGYCTVIVAVAEDCPLTHVNVAQLARAFGADATPRPVRWGSVGATGTWAEEALIPIAPKEGSSLLADFFREAVLAGQEWKPATRWYATPAELRLQLSGEPKAMALLAHERELPAGAKILALTSDVRREPCRPSPENLHAGAYPLRLPLNLVFASARGGELAEWLRFFFTDAAAAALERASIVPVPPLAREAQRTRIERP